MLLPVCLCPPQFMLFITRLSLSSSAAAAADDDAATTTTIAAAAAPPPHGDGMQANTGRRLLSSTFQNSKSSLRSEEEDDMQKPWAATDTAALLLSILIDDLVSFCSFLATHPLHSAYLLFFLPYLAQLLSFLSPLLLSTSLLLLVLLTASSYYLDEAPPPAPPEFLGRTCRIVLGVLKDELHGSAGGDQIELFAAMFLSPIDDASPSSRESAAEAVFGELFLDASSDQDADSEGAAFEDAEETAKCEEILLEADDASAIDVGVEIPVPPNSGIGDESAETDDAKEMEKVEEDPPRSKPSRIAHCSSESIDSLQRYGSGKKEREWKRTLACKLYEERMTHRLCKERKAAEGDEEMDLLWEAYEANASEGGGRKKKDKKKAKRIEDEEEEEEEEEEDEDEEVTVGQLCCLQALKLSAGKMNLGIGKKNLMKISKALKGFKLFAGGNSKKKQIT